jgi:hypothetical protein
MQARSEVLADDTALIGLASRSITAIVPREDLKGKLAVCVQTWAIIGWDIGTELMPVIEYHLTEILVDVVMSNGGHDGHETMVSATFKAVHPVTGQSWHLTQPSDVTAYTRTCGCQAKQRGAVGRTFIFGRGEDGTYDTEPKVNLTGERILQNIESFRNNANGVTVAKYGVSYALQHDVNQRQVEGIRDKYALTR